MIWVGLLTVDENKCIFHKKFRNLMPRFTTYTYIFMYDNYAQKIEPIGLVAASASLGRYRPIEIDTARWNPPIEIGVVGKAPIEFRGEVMNWVEKFAGSAGYEFKMAEKLWQVVNKQDIVKRWPLHCLVFEDKPAQLKDVLKENKVQFSRFSAVIVLVEKTRKNLRGK